MKLSFRNTVQVLLFGNEITKNNQNDKKQKLQQYRVSYTGDSKKQWLNDAYRKHFHKDVEMFL